MSIKRTFRPAAVCGLTALLLAVAAKPVAAADAVTFDDLLDQLVDLKRLAEFPTPYYTCKQFSSYERRSKTPDDHDGWFANGDAGHYLRVEDRDGRKEHVMMDADGPGAIVRIWSANPQGVLRVYLDGADTPVITEEMTRLMGGKAEYLPEPISGERSKGWNLYLPIPYAKHCKVTSDKGGFYYHVNYRTYEAGTTVNSLRADDIQKHAAKIAGIAGRLADTRKGGGPPAERTKKPFDVKLADGDEAELWTMDGSKAICGFLVHLKAADMAKAARGVVLYMTFDGEQTVEAPIGDFFGTAPGLIPYASLPLGITDGKPQDMWCHWWMPFKSDAKIRVKNMSGAAVNVEGAVAVMPWTWTDRSMHFNAGWRIERDVPTRPFTDWTHLKCSGQGRFVGGAFHLVNNVRGWWGEGDEKIYVDGEKFPSHFGTGTEDYYGYAWCSPARFVHAYHNQPRCEGPGNYGNTSVNRFHVIDDIPFESTFHFDIENWHWDEKAKTDRAAVNYWYAKPGGSDFFKPITREDVQFEPIAPYKVRRVAGAIEGEAMEVIEKAGSVGPQELGDRYSGETQVYWTQGKPGDKLVLGFVSPEAGSKHVIVRMTKAVDYAQVQLSINGQKAGKVFDLYNGGVVLTDEIDLGAFDLKKGANTLTVEIVGANDKAKKEYMWGLDYLMVK